jgi:CheY-like chemotaxis protein
MGSDVDVLIVDDDLDLVTVITLVLDDLGLRIATATNGREGFEKALSLHPRLIVSDLMMPIMRGDEMLLALRGNPVTAPIPFILMTSAPAQVRGSVPHLLTKPFDLQQLEVMVERAIA